MTQELMQELIEQQREALALVIYREYVTSLGPEDRGRLMHAVIEGAVRSLANDYQVHGRMLQWLTGEDALRVLADNPGFLSLMLDGIARRIGHEQNYEVSNAVGAILKATLEARTEAITKAVEEAVDKAIPLAVEKLTDEKVTWRVREIATAQIKKALP